VVKRNGAAIVIAPLVIRGRTYQFVVDTGATATVVDQSYAAQLGLVRTKAAPIRVAGVTGTGTAYLATIKDWQIGKAKIPTSTITVSTVNLGPGLVGLLGSDVLSTFGKITINYSAQTASLG
jgi:predicted aspartyl protease